VVIPKDTEAQRLVSFFISNSMEPRFFIEDSIYEIRPNDDCFFPFHVHCNCGSSLGRKNPNIGKSSMKLQGSKRVHDQKQDNKKQNYQNMLEDLNKKIQDEIRKKKKEAYGNRFQKEPDENVSYWLQTIRNALESGTFKKIGLLIHWDDNQPWNFEQQYTYQLKQLDGNLLETMQENCIYEFIP
jgi:hypothetical protein